MPAPQGVGNSSPIVGGDGRYDRDDSGRRFAAESDPPPVLPSTREFRNRELGAVQQGVFESVNLVGVQSRLAASAARLLQASDASGLPSSVPAAGRLGADTQALGNRTLTEPTVEEFGGSKPPLLELVKIALQSVGVSHAPLDTANLKPFTILYRYQSYQLCAGLRPRTWHDRRFPDPGLPIHPRPVLATSHKV